MTTFFLTLILILPIPIALGVRPPRHNDADPAQARAVRHRLIWIASGLAAITLTHRAFLWFIGATTANAQVQPWLPEVIAIWIPWLLLVRYLTLLKKGKKPTVESGPKRYARLQPAEMSRVTRLAWITVALGWLGSALVIGKAAWQSDTWIAAMLLLLAPMWLAFGYQLSRSALIRDPEPFPDEYEKPDLSRAYAQRRSLIAWSIFGIFAAAGIFHTTLAAATVWQSSTALAASVAVAVTTLAMVLIVHWQRRKKIDGRIAALIASRTRT